MAFGQFMALIDIHIVAASLNDVRAGLSAGPDEISWAQTDNLMAELMVGALSLARITRDDGEAEALLRNSRETLERRFGLSITS
jgi:hypothetical protein